MLALLILFTSLVAFYARKSVLSYCRLLYYGFRLPTAGGALPLIGHVHKALVNNNATFDFLCDVSKETSKGDGIAKLWVGPYPVFLITDPKAYKKLANNCLDKNYVYRYLTCFLDGSIVLANASLWRQRIKIIRPSFASKEVGNFMDVFNEYSRQMSDEMESKSGSGPFLIRPLLSDVTSKMIFHTAFGMRPDEEMFSCQQYNEYFHQGMEHVTKRLTNPLFHFDIFYKRSALSKSIDKINNILHETSLKVLRKAKEKYSLKQEDDSDERFRPLIELLLKNNESGGLSEQDLRAELDAVIITFPSVAMAASAVLIHLGAYPATREKLHKELQEIYGGTDRDVTKDDLSQMVYLEAVIKETLRLYPVIPIAGRQLDRDMPFNQYTLPAGASVFVSHWGINRQSCWGADADQFRPERWLDRDTLPSRLVQDNAFGIGIRYCPGRMYTMAAMKTIVTYVIRRYRVISSIEDIKFQFAMSLHPASDQAISVELR